jgi:hypothetical protein
VFQHQMLTYIGQEDIHIVKDLKGGNSDIKTEVA